MLFYTTIDRTGLETAHAISKAVCYPCFPGNNGCHSCYRNELLTKNLSFCTYKILETTNKVNNSYTKMIAFTYLQRLLIIPLEFPGKHIITRYILHYVNSGAWGVSNPVSYIIFMIEHAILSGGLLICSSADKSTKFFV